MTQKEIEWRDFCDLVRFRFYEDAPFRFPEKQPVILQLIFEHELGFVDVKFEGGLFRYQLDGEGGLSPGYQFLEEKIAADGTVVIRRSHHLRSHRNHTFIDLLKKQISRNENIVFSGTDYRWDGKTQTLCVAVKTRSEKSFRFAVTFDSENPLVHSFSLLEEFSQLD